MSAEGRKARRVTGSLLGAILAAATASGAAVGLSSTGAGAAPAAATPEPTSVILNAIPPTAAVGTEPTAYTGTVSGVSGDGYPTSGPVTIVATKGGTATTFCTGSLTTSTGAGDATDFTCAASSSVLAAGTYAIHASYAGGASSDTTFTYDAHTSSSQPLRVTTPEATTVTLDTITSPVTFGDEAQTFKGTVTGQTGDGYPTGSVLIVATKGGTATTLCTRLLTAGSGDVASFTCDASTASKLAPGSYTVHAHYAGGSSSSTAFTYRAQTSTPPQPLTVATATTVTPTVTLNAITASVKYGSEAQTFTGEVTGAHSDGYPKSGTVTVKTSTNVVLCTAALTEPGSGTHADFSCDASTQTRLPVGTYSVHAHFTGGPASKTGFAYAAATSTSRALTVTSGVTTTTTLAISRTTVLAGAETTSLFTTTVTGKSGDGYPKGTVTVKSTTGVTLCSTSTRTTGTTDSSTFTCSSSASALAAGSYKLTATYAPTATHSSSTTSVAYAGSSSSGTVKLTVDAGVATTTTLSLNATSRRAGAETAEVFTVTVTGKSGDGYPKGTVKVKTSGGTVVCTKTSSTSHTTDAATYSCSPGASTLGAGSYSVAATYTPSVPSSSTTAFAYAASTSKSTTFTVTAAGPTRIYGPTPDATAAQELESVYPGTRGDCPGTGSTHPVVLATDSHYPDALASSYLTKYLGTGMLLTPTSTLSAATTTALRVEGITHVYVVGGALAVTTAVVSQIESAFVYDCGGSTRTSTHITVTRISGTTQYTTAEDIARTPPESFVASADLQGAYGLYNDTSGKSSAAPAAGSRRTAVLASGAEFQDAEAAATLSYADGFPLLLTTPTALSAQALGAISTLGITQVVLMGGPLAVSNAVVTSLVAHGVSVLRVAGSDYTDTAVQLADLELGTASGHRGLGWAATSGVTVSRGNFYTDGLAGAIVSAHGGATGKGPQPMLLTETPTAVGTYLTDFLETAGTKGIDDDGTAVTSLTVLGGPLAVSTAVVTAMERDL